jgi:DUF1009 family protein
MMINMFLVVTTFVASVSLVFQQPSLAKGTSSVPIKTEQKNIDPSTTNLTKLIQILKRDKVYTAKMRAMIKEVLDFEKSFGSQTKMTKPMQKKLEAKARVLAKKYPKEILVINRYINK